MTTVEREITIPASPGDVWPAVTHSDELSTWFGADVELDARPGGRGVFRWPDGTERQAVVEDVEAGRRLSFRWLPFQRTPEGEAVAVPSTRVEVTVDAVPEGTPARGGGQPALSLPTALQARAAPAGRAA